MDTSEKESVSQEDSQNQTITTDNTDHIGRILTSRDPSASNPTKSITYRQTILDVDSVRIGIVVAAVILWIIACFLPAFVPFDAPIYELGFSNNGDEIILGYMAFLLGFMAFFVPFSFIAWLANVMSFITILPFIKNRIDNKVAKNLKRRSVFIFIAVFFAEFFVIIPDLSGSSNDDHYRLGIGGILWAISMLLIAVPSFILSRRSLRGETIVRVQNTPALTFHEQLKSKSVPAPTVKKSSSYSLYSLVLLLTIVQLFAAIFNVPLLAEAHSNIFGGIYIVLLILLLCTIGASFNLLVNASSHKNRKQKTIAIILMLVPLAVVIVFRLLQPLFATDTQSTLILDGIKSILVISATATTGFGSFKSAKLVQKE